MDAELALDITDAAIAEAVEESSRILTEDEKLDKRAREILGPNPFDQDLYDSVRQMLSTPITDADRMKAAAKYDRKRAQGKKYNKKAAKKSVEGGEDSEEPKKPRLSAWQAQRLRRVRTSMAYAQVKEKRAKKLEEMRSSIMECC